MDTADLLKKAWLAVEQSGVPPELFESAFSTAIDHLQSELGAKRPANDGHKSPVASDQTISSTEPQDVDAILARLASESGVKEAEIREVLFLDPDGTVAILTPGRELGESTCLLYTSDAADE